MGPQERPSSLGIGPEPRPKRGVDPAEVGRPAGHGHDRDAQRLVDAVQVEDVEPADDRAVDEHRADPVDRPGRADERDHRLGPVSTVHPDPRTTYGFDVRRGRHDHRRDRGERVPSAERPVVDADDPGMILREGPPQG